jgi:hypothetical protein
MLRIMENVVTPLLGKGRLLMRLVAYSLPIPPQWYSGFAQGHPPSR